MEAPDRVLRRSSRRSRCCITVAVSMAVVAVLVIVIAVAVVFTQRRHPRDLATTILVPLYMYPDLGVWDPLFEAVTTHSEQKFTIIVNPDSGPGAPQLPGTEYTTQIQNLTQYPNVQAVGYVRTGYGSRDVRDILRDIATYSQWETTRRANVNASAMAMHGIFFDEAPHDYTPEAAEFLTTINQAAKDAAGVLEPKTIIHNPGSIPDNRLADANTDITVFFEESFQSFRQQRSTLEALPGDRSSKSYIIHSIPSSTKLRKLVNQLAIHAEHLFLTDLTTDYYESFGGDWQRFVDSMTP